jgi:hypothetical protein
MVWCLISAAKTRTDVSAVNDMEVNEACNTANCVFYFNEGEPTQVQYLQDDGLCSWLTIWGKTSAMIVNKTPGT